MYDIIFIDGESLGAELTFPGTQSAPTPEQVDSVRLMQKLGNDLSGTVGDRPNEGDRWIDEIMRIEDGESEEVFQPTIDYCGNEIVRAHIAKTDCGPTGRDGSYIFPIQDVGLAIGDPVNDYDWEEIPGVLNKAAMGGVLKVLNR